MLSQHSWENGNSLPRESGREVPKTEHDVCVRNYMKPNICCMGYHLNSCKKAGVQLSTREFTSNAQVQSLAIHCKNNPQTL